MICIRNALIAAICRDPETAEGGLDPYPSDYHAPGFYLQDRETLEFLTGQSIDRRVEIAFKGTEEWLPLANPVSGFDMLPLTIVIRVGYFVGDHGPESFIVMAEDDRLIQNAILSQSNWPECDGLCISGLIPVSGERIRIDSTRHVWEITVEAVVS